MPESLTPKLTVLVIDDEPAVLEVLEGFLEALGYTSLSAATGVAGLTALKKKPADAVLLDIAMPGALGGVDTLCAIRASWPDLPVIMVTANIDDAIAQATLREGEVDYVMARPRKILATAMVMSGKEPPP